MFKPSLLTGARVPTRRYLYANCTVLRLHACDDSRSSQASDSPFFVVVRHATARITTQIPRPARWPSAGRWFDDESARRQSGMYVRGTFHRPPAEPVEPGSQGAPRGLPGSYLGRHAGRDIPNTQSTGNSEVLFQEGRKCLFASTGGLEIIRNHRAPGSVGHNVRTRPRHFYESLRVLPLASTSWEEKWYSRDYGDPKRSRVPRLRKQTLKSQIQHNVSIPALAPGRQPLHRGGSATIRILRPVQVSQQSRILHGKSAGNTQPHTRLRISPTQVEKG